MDAYCLLHRGAYTCSRELVEGEPTEKHITYCMARVELLLSGGVKPLVVFDGGRLPNKLGEERSRQQKRDENRARARSLWAAGNKAAAMECYQRSVDITPAHAKQFVEVGGASGGVQGGGGGSVGGAVQHVPSAHWHASLLRRLLGAAFSATRIFAAPFTSPLTCPTAAPQPPQALKRRGVPFIVAPYEADAQMAYLALTGQVDVVFTEDSDLLCYGCPTVRRGWTTRGGVWGRGGQTGDTGARQWVRPASLCTSPVPQMAPSRPACSACPRPYPSLFCTVSPAAAAAGVFQNGQGGGGGGGAAGGPARSQGAGVPGLWARPLPGGGWAVGGGGGTGGGGGGGRLWRGVECCLIKQSGAG